ncbi:hypothetical protein BC832DRAFT_545656 [Gaertneriomyces semiglobifer]|nr:hypothetical protein BC832DRAFT_545656 [Gaertneriomyces semiglobifer]
MNCRILTRWEFIDRALRPLTISRSRHVGLEQTLQRQRVRQFIRNAEAWVSISALGSLPLQSALLGFLMQKVGK